MAVRLPTDEELLSRLKGGQEGAFVAIYERHGGAVYAYVQRFLRSPELSEDLAQEVFLKFWEKRQEPPGLLSVKAYLLTMARNQAFNFLKRAGVDELARAELLRHYPAAGNSLENAVHFRDYKVYLDKLLAELTPQSREVFRLCREQGKTYEEAAELLGISRNAVKKHMVRSMRVLGDKVERDLGISLPLLLALMAAYPH